MAELGVDRQAGVGAAHWLPQAHTPPASLACGSLASPSLQLLLNSGASTSCWAMSSCNQIGVAPAMDMPEVLKSLLEHSLSWPEKRTGRNTGDLYWQGT